MTSKVLVAVDGSENSNRALDFALDLTEKYSATLTVINVSESSAVASISPATASYGSDGSMFVVARDMRKFHEEILEKALVHAKQVKPNISVTPVLREGEPAAEIVSLAKEGGFEVVVVGHQGAGKVRALFLGSISDKVARSLDRTVIIVR